MVESKFYNNGKNKDRKIKYNFKNQIRSFIFKVLITIIVFLIVLILFKLDSNFKVKFNEYVYNKSLPFTSFKDVYNTYFLGKKDKSSVDAVFYEKLTYNNQSLYEDGVKLSVNNNYLVPALESGIVVFVGEKEKYGKTIIVQQVNGIDVFYGNVNGSVNMYDYIEKGSLIGEVLSDELFLAFQKEGKFIDYKEFIE